ncbi:MAG: DUF349 domain-containing protein [Tannerella sp.]|nr:DUF349 domain-containing protein [Tannerella sp.]
MMDTQETNLPEEGKIFVEETGKLKEPQTPEDALAETTIETEVKVGEPETIIEEADADGTEAEVEGEEAEIKDEEPDAEVEKPDVEAETVDAEVEELNVKVENVGAEIEATDAEVEELDAKAESPDDVTAEAAETVTVDVEVTETDVKVEDAEAKVEDLGAEDIIVNEENEVSPASEDREDDIVTSLDTVALAAITIPEIIERLKQIVVEPQKYARNEADVLKQTYYKLRRAEIETKKKEFLEEGRDEKDFVIPEDVTETELKALISECREKRASIIAEEERRKEANYILKQHLVDRLKALTESQDDFNKRYNEFREIQRKWKEIKLISQDHAKELWRSYQLYNERFYDIVKINNQFRDYDFKKNLELKTALCETVERLDKEPDIISAFHQLQKLHQQWREIGPVSKEFRDLIWERFKEASGVINKKHQGHFESQKAAEEKNLEEKTAICEKIEKVEFEAFKTMRDWERKTEEVIALQKKWRTIGYATRKQNVKIFERFRVACDNYFNKRGEFYKSIKQDMDKNFELKKVLIEKAEAMKHSTDWKEATKVFIEIQNEWKKIGPVARKHSETIWKQFISACDYFFEQKNKESFSQKSEENVNLEAKKALIEKINAIDENLSDEDALTLLRSYISEWSNIGFVPFREKDKLYKSFREATDKQFDRLKIHERDRRMQQFRSNLTDLAGAGKNKLYNERDRLMRAYEKVKNELQTYENNIGFFNVSSKGGGGLLKEMDRKIARLKEDMEVIIKKIEAIDENLE